MLTGFIAQICCSAVESAFDPEGSLREHTGKVVRVELSGISVCLRIDANGKLMAVHELTHADAHVQLAWPAATGKGEKTRASGDSDFLEALKSALNKSDLAPDAWIERTFGQRAGSAAANFIDRTSHGSRDTCMRLRDALRDWLIYEAELVPDPEQVKLHAAQVDEIATRVEALRRAVASR